MDKNTVLGLSIVIIMVIVVVAFMILVKPPVKDIEVIVSEINYENEEFFVNVTVTNNQDETGWISDTSLTTIDGNSISLTGAGIDEKIEPGETRKITLFSAEFYDNILDPPLKLMYTAFPSGNTYSVRI
jgi:hypothetical protein